MITDIHAYRVKDAMSTLVISVDSEDTIHDALTLMAQYRVTVLPVTENRNRCVGVLSTSDLIDPTQESEGERDNVERSGDQSHQELIEQLTESQLSQRRVCELMTASVVAIGRETSILDATGELLRHRIHHLPVVDDDQRVLGILSTMDALSVFQRVHTEIRR